MTIMLLYLVWSIIFESSHGEHRNFANVYTLLTWALFNFTSFSFTEFTLAWFSLVFWLGAGPSSCLSPLVTWFWTCGVVSPSTQDSINFVGIFEYVSFNLINRINGMKYYFSHTKFILGSQCHITMMFHLFLTFQWLFKSLKEGFQTNYN